ncbi:zinc finger CCCH domain-containing protein 67-like isoform X2 [Solanum dulcamara]|uniref:zinc finger CCCH domain-containing protein 67-like isoform X2 n=1 Tax=Solanum dulcamara TaxID=45834 RepID=UPI002486A507|nr:zinc finger CCCH domain-containing protein 67-like isoform X2 [Solanum dulcamara]
MEAVESLCMYNLKQPILDKQYLGFDPQPPETPSISSEPNLQNPPRNLPITEENDVDDEIALQTIVDELQNLVLNQAFSDERAKGGIHEYIKAKSENEDEKAVQMIVEEIQNLVLNLAFSEERAKGDIHEGIGRDEIVNEYGGNRYEDGDNSLSENVNVIDVKNEKGGEAGSEKWGFDHYEDGDYSWSENGILIDVENEKGGEAGSKEWGFDHYEDGDHSWSGNGIDVANENGSDAGSKEWGCNANGRRLNYPLRPDAVDCAYYMKTGTCQYGLNCKFNHPSRRSNQWAMERGKQKEESEERAGLIECKYYLTEGGCKYGNACKYNHSGIQGASSPVLDFNFLGLPVRPGEKDCPYYMRTGTCKYGSNCRFHHPDPTTMTGNNPSFGYNNGESAPVQSASYSPVSSWSSSRASNETAPFLPVVYAANQGILPLGPQWNRFQAPVYPTPEKSLPAPPAFTMKDPATKTNIYSRPQPPWLVEEYPERPGQPDCSYFIKTGDCKYKSNCKFHHPKTQKSKTNLPSILSDKGLPLRPGQALCSFYSRYGICKYGPACKFDHPEQNDNAVSSPGFPFYQPPFGNSATTDGLRMSRKGNGSGSLVQQSV